MSTHAAATHAPSAGQFHWEPQPRAQAVVNDLVASFLVRCPDAQELADRMKHETGTRFVDWIDTIVAQRTDALRARLLDAGFERKPTPGAPDAFIHLGGMFPMIVLDSDDSTRLAIKVDSVVDFLSAWNITDESPIDGDPLAPMRRARAFRGDGAEMWVIERHGYRGFAVPKADPDRSMNYLRHLEAFRRRTREWPDDELGFDHTDHLVDAAVRDLGPDLSCDAFFFAEREYWQRRNRAAQIQKARQDKLGLGWANHDHHTYRNSRTHFHRCIRVLEKLGFVCRERFYAGHEAGWGAQVLEQPIAGMVIFADVDMTESEVAGDFAHSVFPPRSELGTVGLWCGLHGESMLEAGLHHLECQFDHDALRDQLKAANVGSLPPFTNFPFLRQAFTEGEHWPVREHRIERLLKAGTITTMQANQFRMQGAIGSHLENLERNDGYKGFNQKGVSDIIARTDPRRQAALVGA